MHMCLFTIWTWHNTRFSVCSIFPVFCLTQPNLVRILQCFSSTTFFVLIAIDDFSILRSSTTSITLPTRQDYILKIDIQMQWKENLSSTIILKLTRVESIDLMITMIHIQEQKITRIADTSFARMHWSHWYVEDASPRPFRQISFEETLSPAKYSAFLLLSKRKSFKREKW